jgi:transcriptional regulator GlxA family with amidase domain
MATRMQVSRDLLAWQRRAAKTGARMGSVCTGAFVLGAAGLLDGRACTTHWSRVADLRRRFPKTKVLEDRLYVADGHLHPGVHRVQDWIAAHPERPAALPDLAELAAMSVRSLTRQFREATGLSVKAARPRCAWSGPETCCGIPS